MKITTTLAIAAGLTALSACNKQTPAENVAENAALTENAANETMNAANATENAANAMTEANAVENNAASNAAANNTTNAY
jgi:hypothetical protein